MCVYVCVVSKYMMCSSNKNSSPLAEIDTKSYGHLGRRDAYILYNIHNNKKTENTHIVLERKFIMRVAFLRF